MWGITVSCWTMCAAFLVVVNTVEPCPLNGHIGHMMRVGVAFLVALLPIVGGSTQHASPL